MLFTSACALHLCPPHTHSLSQITLTVSVLIDLLRLQTRVHQATNTTLHVPVCACVSVCACLSAEYVKQQLQCVLIALLAFVYVLFFLPYGNDNNSQNAVLHSAHTPYQRETRSLALRLRSVDRSHSHSYQTRTDSLSPPTLVSCFVRSISVVFVQFSCLRAVFECATGLRKALLGRLFKLI